MAVDLSRHHNTWHLLVQIRSLINAITAPAPAVSCLPTCCSPVPFSPISRVPACCRVRTKI